MKKLLAYDGEAIYSLGPAFRAGEKGQKHLPEFLMLEWYRPGFDLGDLQREITDLVQFLADGFEAEFKAPKIETYGELFQARYSVDPHVVADKELRGLLEAEYPEFAKHLSTDAIRSDYLDSLFSVGVEPELQAPTFVSEFPACQASLAKVSSGIEPVALRTELYWQGLELANGYDELRSGEELRRRMTKDNELRKKLRFPEILVDEDLLVALDELPPCCGVALGVDRLLMLLLGESGLSQIQPTPWRSG